ncbi:hypothetical protein EXS56_02205 [Candidatus Kaiserbacteria bacterium]|nr:hypothetical protein [Candidatus Kaiserbacteria bacterium]
MDIETLLSQWLDKKYRLKLERLALKSDFVSEMKSLQRKHLHLIKKHRKYQELTGVAALACFKEGYYDEQGNYISGVFDEQCLKRKKVPQYNKKTAELLLDKKLRDESIGLAKKFKLYPAEEWSNIIVSIFFCPPECNYLTAAMYDDPFFMKKTKNCVVVARVNPSTNEEELLLKIFPDTSIDDVKKSWPVVAEQQKQLRTRLGQKRFYPHKNLKIAEKIKKLKEQGVSEWEIQEQVYGESMGLDFGKEEVKKKARIRKIIQRTRT